jgi:hypothetical protein
MDAAQFTLAAVLVRVAFRRPPRGDHFGLPVPADWRQAACVVGMAGAVAFGWLVYGTGWLPFGASLVVAFAAFAASGLCESLAACGWSPRTIHHHEPVRP